MAYPRYPSGPYAHGHGYLYTCYGYPYNGAPHQSSNGSPYQSASSTAPVNSHLAAGDYTTRPNVNHSSPVTQIKSEPVDDNNWTPSPYAAEAITTMPSMSQVGPPVSSGSPVPSASGSTPIGHTPYQPATPTQPQHQHTSEAQQYAQESQLQRYVSSGQGRDGHNPVFRFNFTGSAFNDRHSTGARFVFNIINSTGSRFHFNSTNHYDDSDESYGGDGSDEYGDWGYDDGGYDDTYDAQIYELTGIKVFFHGRG